MYVMENVGNDARKVMIIAGIIMFILGFIGNILNICVFAIWSRPRTRIAEHHTFSETNNISLYLLVSSIANLIVVLYPLLTRVIIDGYNYSVSVNNVFLLCKLRFFVLHTFDFISLASFCMATFDRYLITSREVHIRRLSTTRHRTKQIILAIFILFSLHNIPIAIYFQVSNTGQCDISLREYSHYYLYVCQVLLHGIVPIIFLSVFGSLTLKHLKRLQSQRHAHGHGHLNHDKQLSHILFLMSFAIIMSSIPYCIENIYYDIFYLHSTQQTSSIFLLHVICTLLFYTNPVSSFYVYFISTQNFRYQIKKLIRCNRHEHIIVHNQIHTITTAQNIH
ncbi:unnamed protein product [Rotaria sp. Silwood1]|nr:unnamed protein product [Rotaria sp. Silwood1]CAF1152206.1 unnamed protein product [Rotaria sp. Silwood1]CAF3441166.1 unnamed protein product [Rotaria sp. Silwood1]CAF4621616.1 unnamed protein product [Rotaria sp. Silwood1]CAF4722692.1 unnamed protein product [Rotaria sp. Silwood1]